MTGYKLYFLAPAITLTNLSFCFYLYHSSQEWARIDDENPFPRKQNWAKYLKSKLSHLSQKSTIIRSTKIVYKT